MIPNSVTIENLSFYADDFSVTNTGNNARGFHPDNDRDMNPESENYLLHPTQRGSRRVKLTLLFWIPGEEAPSYDYFTEKDQRPEKLPRLASVKVPRGCPIFKLRKLIKHVEGKLRKTYGFAERCRIVMIGDPYLDLWEYDTELPMTDVIYV